MRIRLFALVVLAALSLTAAVAQQGQSVPLYDPNDPIGRILPPNLHFMIDVSGSMSCQPNGPDGGQCSNYDYAGLRTDSKIYITKTAITSLMSRDSLRVRWSFWSYTNNSDYATASSIAGSYYYFPSGLYRTTYPTYNTYFWSGSGCSGSRDRLLTPIYHAALTDDDQWFKSSVDAGYDNRPGIRIWVDRNFNRSTGCVNVPGLSSPFMTELGGRGSTPISYSLESILQYSVGKNRSGSNSNAYYFDLTTGTDKYWTQVENSIDPYYACRYNAVLLLTDGRDTCEGVTTAQNAAGTLHNTYKIDTFVVGFGLQSASDKAGLDGIASRGGTTQAYFADNEASLLAALDKILGQLGTEISGDTEPVLGYIKPDAISWPVAMPAKVELQNVVLKASCTYSPVFKGHLRAFQALTTSSQADKVDFLTDFTKTSPYLLWDFGEYLDNVDPATRTIYYLDGTSLRSFTTSNRSSIRSLAGLSLTDAQMDAFINWIRSQPMGSVTYSTPAFIGPPNPKLYNTAEYINWAKNLSDRTPMTLIGTNDGMLHCVNLLTGEELWALIMPPAIEGTTTKPARLYTEMYASGNASSQGQPDVYGDRIYGRRPHYYYMASSPKTMDVRMASGDWRTVCVFGLGAGGREYFCLNITDPNAPSYMWRFGGVSSHPLGETWSVPGLGRFAPSTTNYPFGYFGAVIGSGFNLNPSNPYPTAMGKSVYILNVASSTTTPEILYQYHMTDTTQTGFGATPTSNLSAVGNCFFAPPVLYDKPSDYDSYIDKVFIGDYAGYLYRLTLDGTNIANSTMTKYFQTKNLTPVYSVPFVAEVYLTGSGKKTLIAFTEYGSPTDTAVGGVRKPGVAYCLVEENLGDGLNTTASLVASTGTASTFNPASSGGFYFEMPSPGEGESSPFRPTLFWQDDTVWMGFTSYLFFPNASGGLTCDPITHTVNAGRSKAYLFDMTTGRYLSAQAPVDLGSGSTFYGRASAFHKGARGEGWTDIGTGELWGWGFSQSTHKFEKFDTSKGNVTYDMNPTAGVEVHNNYWREFK